MRTVIDRLLARTVEAGVGVFVIVNGILTFSPESSVRANIENVIGYGSFVVPTAQILSGGLKLFGIAANKGNCEAAGLIMVAMMFFIRIFMLCADGEVSLQDWNSITIAVLIIFCNIIRLRKIILNIQTIEIQGGSR